MRSSKASLFLIYFRQVSAGLLIYQPVFIPFLLSRGLDMMGVAWLQTAYNLGVLAFAIPAGYFADRIGRKWALAAANISFAIGTALIAYGHSMTIFVVAELIYALAIAMDAGCHSAYLYEWLRERGRESEYYRFDALGTFLMLFIGAAGTFVAGYFAERDLALPVIFTIATTAVGIPAALLLPKQAGGLRKPLQPAAQASHASREEAACPGVLAILRRIFTTPGLVWALGVTVLWYWSRQYVNLFISQPYFRSIHLPLRYFGIMYSILTLASGLIALFSRRWIQKPDLRLITFAGLFTIPTSFLLMGAISSWWGLSGFFVFALPFGLCTAVSNTLLNRQFPLHDSRATFLGIVDFFTRAVSSLLAIVLGWVVARYSASYALLGAAALGYLALALLLPGILRFGRGEESL